MRQRQRLGLGTEEAMSEQATVSISGTLLRAEGFRVAKVESCLASAFY